jgi:hypothetical protein
MVDERVGVVESLQTEKGDSRKRVSMGGVKPSYGTVSSHEVPCF